MIKLYAEPSMSDSELAILGSGEIAYIRLVMGAEVKSLFPNAPEVPANQRYFALYSADGTPIMLTDTRELAVANAWHNELRPMSVH